ADTFNEISLKVATKDTYSLGL
ncbi:hypothetical protein LCGC14_3153390, partial [marine sediment metagenome]